MRTGGVLLTVVILLGIAVVPATGAPGPALSVNFAAPMHPISPYIYGMNDANPALGAELALPVQRWGGNNTSRYHWQLDTTSIGSDYYFSIIPYKYEGNGGAVLPDESVINQYIEQNASWGGTTIVTVPMIGWMPKDDEYLCGFSVTKYGAQTEVEPWRDECGNGVLADGNNTIITWQDEEDTSVPITGQFVEDWVEYLVNRYGGAAGGGITFYNLDNEPMLWNETHRDVHQAPNSYDEMRDRTYEYARAVKNADPNAQTLGPVGFGWTEYFYSALDWAAGGAWWNNPIDRLAHGGVPFVEWYLQKMAKYEGDHGIRILDYLDEHFYPQNGVSLNSNVDAYHAALRLRSTRSLWDPTYMDESWISDGGPTAVMLIPRMKQWVADNYPGTKTAITEYNWGALNHRNGALAQADILGIFGREGLDLATLWAPPGPSDPGAYAFRMYLNYDDAGGTFGDVSVAVSSSDQSQLAIYASLRTSDCALPMVVVNKTSTDLTSTISLTGFDAASQVEVWQYSAANLNAIVRQADAAAVASQINHTYPAESITLLVARQASNDLICNSGFEFGLAPWTISNATKDKVKCNPDNPTKVAHTGVCGLKLTGTPSVTTKAKQTLVSAGSVGDTLTLDLWAKGKNLTATTKVKVKLIYATAKEALKVSVPLGSHAFEPLSVSGQLAAALTELKIQIVIKPGAGKVYVDDVSLTLSGAARGSILPPPAIPDGWRR